MEYIDGLFIKKPHPKAPSFIKCKLSIKRDKLINWLQTQEDEWINIDIKESQKGDFYAQIDTWKPDVKNKQVLNNEEENNQSKLSNIKEDGNGYDNINGKEVEYPEDEISVEDIPFN